MWRCRACNPLQSWADSQCNINISNVGGSVEEGRGREPTLDQSAPPPHTASRGGVNATQMAQEREIAGCQSGKGYADQDQRGRVCLLRFAPKAKFKLCCVPPGVRVQRGRVARRGRGTHRQGYGVRMIMGAAEGEHGEPEQR